MNYEKPLAHKIDFASGWVVRKLGALCLYSSQDQGGSYMGQPTERKAARR